MIQFFTAVVILFVISFLDVNGVKHKERISAFDHVHQTSRKLLAGWKSYACRGKLTNGCVKNLPSRRSDDYHYGKWVEWCSWKDLICHITFKGVKMSIGSYTSYASESGQQPSQEEHEDKLNEWLQSTGQTGDQIIARFKALYKKQEQDIQQKVTAKGEEVDAELIIKQQEWDGEQIKLDKLKEQKRQYLEKEIHEQTVVVHRKKQEHGDLARGKEQKKRSVRTGIESEGLPTITDKEKQFFKNIKQDLINRDNKRYYGQEIEVNYV